MDEKESNDFQSIKKLEKYIDSNFLLMSNMVNDKYSDLETKIKQSPEKITNNINKVVVDSAHKLYSDICNEQFKKLEEVKRKILFRVNVVIVIGIFIIVLEIINMLRK